jgi:hypothetical protein
MHKWSTQFRTHPRQWIFVAVTTIVWLLISFDGRLHWDEPSYIYTATYIPWHQILYEGFEPSGIQGFNVSRLGHLAIVKIIASITGPGHLLFGTVVVIYLLFLLGLAIASYLILRLLMPNATRIAPAVSITLFAPMMVYLAWKTTPDIPALFFSGLASLFFLLSMGSQPLIWIVLSAFFLALTGLTKHIIAWQFISMVLAILFFAGYRWSLRTVLGRLILVSLGALLIFGMLLAMFNIPLSQFLAFLSVASSASEPLAAKLFKLLLTFGSFYLVIPLGLMNPNRRLKWFMGVWFILATVPFLIAVPRLEVRYLITSFIPLAGFTCLALEHLYLRKNRSRYGFQLFKRPLTVSLIAVIVVVTSMVVQPFSEHEVRTDQFGASIKRIEEVAGDQPFSVLVPWEYTDFHYLRITHPQLPVFTVYENQSFTTGELASWKKFQDQYYGDKVLHSLDQLLALEGEKFYVGFGYTFPIENILSVLESPVLKPSSSKLVDIVQSMSPLIHLHKSWLWNHPNVELQFVEEVGHYQIYRVRVKD